MIDATLQISDEQPSDDALEKYQVSHVRIDDIKPSPENDDLYGEIECDEQMEALMESIRNIGLEEPIILTADRYILSGHRRFFAVSNLEWQWVPCRIRYDISRANSDDYHKALAEYNPQRIKTVGALLKEALLRDEDPEDTYAAIKVFRASSAQVDVDFMTVRGSKAAGKISKAKMPFLEAVKRVVYSLEKYWPLSIRQIHYNLLNDPPLISTFKRSSKPIEDYRYRNNKASYKALVELLKPARYLGHIPMNCIDDQTRPQLTHNGYSSVSEFVNNEILYFLSGYHRDRQLDQPRHIEVFAEKNTVYGLLRSTAQEYYTPLSAGRGFCSVPVWRDIAKRFRDSGKDSMTLIIVSDFDPEGLELADDAIRSLRDLWEIPVEGHRVCITPQQIEELDLAEDFNPAKESSSRFEKFVERTGGTRTWELEALPPDYLIERVKAAIEANMDMDIFEQVVDQEHEDAENLWEIKQSIARQMEL